MSLLSKKYDQQQTQKQRHTLKHSFSPRQIQFAHLIRLPYTSFEKKVKEEVTKNPLLKLDAEVPDTKTIEQEEDPFPKLKNENIISPSIVPTYSEENRGSYDTIFKTHAYERTPLEYLEQQIGTLNFSTKHQLIAEYIIGSLDGSGYCRLNPETIANNLTFQTGLDIFKEDVEVVRYQIRYLGPIGIASQNLRECLLTQAQALSSNHSYKDQIINLLSNHWDDFSSNNISKIEKIFSNKEELEHILSITRSFNPKPMPKDIDAHHDNMSIIPDFEVSFIPAYKRKNYDPEQFIDNCAVYLLAHNNPRITIRNNYDHTLNNEKKRKEYPNKEWEKAMSFVKNYTKEGQSFIDLIQQRKETLLKTMRAIVRKQYSFFSTGKSLQPMTMKDIAHDINMDISTVSRTVNGKYVQSDFGVYELRYFFSIGIASIDGKKTSTLEIKKLLKEIIISEPYKKPHSDNMLSDLLKKKGLNVARRTIAKYRHQLDIGPAYLRKKTAR